MYTANSENRPSDRGGCLKAIWIVILVFVGLLLILFLLNFLTKGKIDGSFPDEGILDYFIRYMFDTIRSKIQYFG